MSQYQHLVEKHRAALDAAKGIFTWTKPEELAWLAEEASQRYWVLEIGTYAGHSAKVISHAMFHASGIMLPKKLICFDYCPDKGIPEQALANLDYEIRKNRIEYYQRDAGVSAVQVNGSGQRFDMIWIDDGHTYQDVIRDCLIALLLKKDESTFICGHDYEGEVAKAVNDCFGAANIKRGPGSIWYL